MAGKQIHVHIHGGHVKVTGKIRTKDNFAKALEDDPEGVGTHAARTGMSESKLLQEFNSWGINKNESYAKKVLAAFRREKSRSHDSATEQDADPAKEAARKYAFAVAKIDQLSSEIEKLNDKGQTIPPQLRTQLTTFQQEVAKAPADVKAMAKQLGFVDAVGESFTTLAAAKKKVEELKAAGYSNAKEKQEYDTTKPKPYPTYWIVERGEKDK